MRIRLVIGSLIALVVVAPSRGATPLGTAFSYQGQLKEAGVPLDDTADFQFTLWDAAGSGNPPTGGIQVGGVQAINALPVTAGFFTVTLNGGGEFGGNAFIGNARWLQIAVRTPAGGGTFTALAPRQPLTATPHALLALDAEQLGGIDAIEYVTSAGAGNTFIKNGTAQQPTSNFNISGNGTAGSLNANGTVSLGGIAPPAAAPAGQGRVYFDAASNKMKVSENNGAFVNMVGAGGVSGSGTTNTIPFWSAGTTLGTSLISQSGGTVQLPGFVSLAATASGNNVAFGSPNSETGMTISGDTGRADVRFDGATLRLLAGPPGFTPANGIGVETSGNVIFTPAGSGGNTRFGTPGGESGMTISGTNRADLRFDGTTLKLLAGTGTGAMANSNGINVNTSGNVGIGTVSPNTRLTLSGGSQWTSSFWTASMNLQNAAAIGWEANPSGQRFGIGQSTGGLYFFRTYAAYGQTIPPPNYDIQITDNGDVVVVGAIDIGYEIVVGLDQDAVCPAGKKVLGGGCGTTGSATLREGRPLNNGWHCELGGCGSPFCSIDSYAICARVK